MRGRKLGTAVMIAFLKGIAKNKGNKSPYVFYSKQVVIIMDGNNIITISLEQAKAIMKTLMAPVLELKPSSVIDVEFRLKLIDQINKLSTPENLYVLLYLNNVYVIDGNNVFSITMKQANAVVKKLLEQALDPKQRF